MHDVARIAEEAVSWMRRPFERAGVAGSLAPRILKPAASAFVLGFVRGLADRLGLDAAKRYELEARVFVAVYEGTPMGEQLGLEALQMAQGMASFPGVDAAARAAWADQVEAGRLAAERYLALDASLAPLRSTFA